MANLVSTLLGTRTSTQGTGFGIPGTCHKCPGTGEKIFTGTGTPKIRAGAAKVRATPARRYPVPFFKYPPKRKRAFALFLGYPWGRQCDFVSGAVVDECDFSFGVQYLNFISFVFKYLSKLFN